MVVETFTSLQGSFKKRPKKLQQEPPRKPTWTPGAPQERPRRLQEPPGAVQEDPGAAQEATRGPEEPPGALQEGPQRRQERPKRRPERPREPQGSPKRRQEASGSDFGAILERSGIPWDRHNPLKAVEKTMFLRIS